MGDDKHYLDLLKAHKIFVDIEGRWKFYDAYMDSRNGASFMECADIPLREGLLLFGFVHSWDPNFQGDLAKFLGIYKQVFPQMKSWEDAKLEEVDLTADVRSSIAVIFNRIAYCPRKKRFESTDASKILHAILPGLFVMWDSNIRKGVVREQEGNGTTYANEFLPKMQDAGREYLTSYKDEKRTSVKLAARDISRIAGGYTLAKLLDELNYVRYTKRKSLAEIRQTAFP